MLMLLGCCLKIFWIIFLIFVVLVVWELFGLIIIGLIILKILLKCNFFILVFFLLEYVFIGSLI